eukprot:snap_masked-scaffold_13-processed-gene-0.19-mRNA-1 protein AED:1.00 eAED:1.00 QI:0/-1/0/0/-1/1/1/0/581
MLQEDLNKNLKTSAVRYSEAFKDWCTVQGVEKNSIELKIVYGKIPAGLEGTWYRNGPGKFQVGGTAVKTLDGDGYIVCVHLQGGSAKLSAKFVKTRGFVQEANTGKFSNKGAFGSKSSSAHGLWKISHRIKKAISFSIPTFKNTGNTNVVLLGGKLLALWEGGLPHLLDPQTLSTIEAEYTFNGELSRYDLFGAHPKIDVKTGDLFNLGVNFFETFTLHGARNQLKIWQFGQDHKMKGKYYLPLVRPFSLLHDFALTDEYIVIPQSPIALDLKSLFFGASLKSALSPSTDPFFIYLIDRSSLSMGHQPQFKLFRSARMFSFHSINAYKGFGNDLVLDVVAYKCFPSFSELMDPIQAEPVQAKKSHLSLLEELSTTISKPVRICLPLQPEAGKYKRKYSRRLSLQSLVLQPDFLWGDGFLNTIQQVTDFPGVIAYSVDTAEETISETDLRSVEFPAIDCAVQGRKHKYTLFVDTTRKSPTDKSSCFQSIVKLCNYSGKVSHWTPEDPRIGLLSDPQVLSSKNITKSYFGVVVFYAEEKNSSDFFIVDLESMMTICRIDLSIRIPISLHTLWVDGSVGGKLTS